MGNDLNIVDERTTRAQGMWASGDAPDEQAIPIVPWLDAHTARQVRAIIGTVARAFPGIVAAIVFGSVARHDERPLDDTDPSDVDILLLLDPMRLGRTDASYPLAREVALHWTIGDAADHTPDAPREVRVLLVEYDLTRWDEAFIEYVARKGQSCGRALNCPNVGVI
jgi:predicted nucleotidyltransferase